MSSQFQIEKNIPIPPLIRGKAGELAVMITPMEVGDSFAFTDDKNKNEQTRIKYAAKKIGYSFTVRRIEGDQYRAWRTA